MVCSAWGSKLGSGEIRPRRKHDELAPACSFDHLVGGGEQRGGRVDAERLGGREINHEIELGRLLDRKVGWLRPTQNLVDKLASTPEQIWEVWSIGHQASRFDVVPRPVHRR